MYVDKALCGLFTRHNLPLCFLFFRSRCDLSLRQFINRHSNIYKHACGKLWSPTCSPDLIDRQVYFILYMASGLYTRRMCTVLYVQYSMWCLAARDPLTFPWVQACRLACYSASSLFIRGLAATWKVLAVGPWCKKETDLTDWSMLKQIRQWKPQSSDLLLYLTVIRCG